MSPEENKESKSVKEPQFLTNVVTFVEQPYPTMLGGKTYVIEVNKIHITLPEFIGLITSFRGTWQSLGMGFNQDVMVRAMEIAIQFVVLQEHSESFNATLASIIEKKYEEREARVAESRAKLALTEKDEEEANKEKAE